MPDIQRDINLQPLNTFGIKAHALQFIECHSLDDLSALILSGEMKGQKHLILGGGSNLLFTGDFDGLVIKNSLKGIEIISEDDSIVTVKAMAGEVWNDLVMHAVENGWGGIENLSLIPGQVGAAPMQNIGAYGVEIRDVLVSVEAMDIKTGEIVEFRNEECEFAYRESIFKTSARNKYIITAITINLHKDPEVNISYGAIKEVLENKGISKPGIKDVSEAVIEIRRSKLPDPAELGNAGSFFKNPEIDKVAFDEFINANPDAPFYETKEGKYKIPAGWMIEQCGWKGKRVGETGAHARQALVLVNYGNAKGSEVEELSKKIRESVQERFGISLQPEVNII